MPSSAPPPSFTPPPVITPPPPPKPRRGRGWMIFAIILLVLLFISLFGNLTQFVSRMLAVQQRLQAGHGPRHRAEAGGMPAGRQRCAQQNRRHRGGRHHHQPRSRPGGQQHGGRDQGAIRPREGGLPRQSRHLESGFARRRSDGFGPNQPCHHRFSGQVRQAGDLLDGQPRGVRAAITFPCRAAGSRRIN